MIAIQPDNDYKKCSLIKGDFPENVFVLTAKDGDEYLGAGAVEMNDGYAKILAVETADGMEALEHGIFKALLNFVERREIYDCICALDKPKMLKMLGFSEADGEWKTVEKDENQLFYLNLTGYFEKHC